jgi:hypothetical protein
MTANQHSALALQQPFPALALAAIPFTVSQTFDGFIASSRRARKAKQGTEAVQE